MQLNPVSSSIVTALTFVTPIIPQTYAAARQRDNRAVYLSRHSRSGSHMTYSKRSSQRQLELESSRLKREELEKQHEVQLRIARQRLENESQTRLRKLEIKQLEEEHRKQVAAAAREEIELMTKPSSYGSSAGKTSKLFTERSSVKSKKLVQVFLNSPPAGIWQMLQMNQV